MGLLKKVHTAFLHLRKISLFGVFIKHLKILAFSSSLAAFFQYYHLVTLDFFLVKLGNRKRIFITIRRASSTKVPIKSPKTGLDSRNDLEQSSPWHLQYSLLHILTMLI